MVRYTTRFSGYDGGDGRNTFERGRDVDSSHDYSRTRQTSSTPIPTRARYSTNTDSLPRSQGYHSLYRDSSPPPRAKAYSYRSVSRDSSRLSSIPPSCRGSSSSSGSSSLPSSSRSRTSTPIWSTPSVASSPAKYRRPQSPSTASSYSNRSKVSLGSDKNITQRLERQYLGWSITDSKSDEDGERAKRLEKMYLARKTTSDEKSDDDDNIAKRLNRKHLGWTNNEMPSSRSSSVDAKPRLRSFSSNSSSSSSDSDSDSDGPATPDRSRSPYRQRYSLQLGGYSGLGRPTTTSLCRQDYFPMPLQSRPKSFAYYDVCKQIHDDLPVMVREVSPAGQARLRSSRGRVDIGALPASRLTGAHYEIRSPPRATSQAQRSRSSSKSGLSAIFSRPFQGHSSRSQSRSRDARRSSLPPPYTEFGRVDPLHDPTYFSTGRSLGGARIVNDEVAELALQGLSWLAH